MGNIEWSGPIWYTTTGKISDPDKMEIRVSEFVLKDIGSSNDTSYKFGGEMVDLFDEKPHLMEMTMGHVHSHHDMRVFFSGTDMKCLHDNAPVFDMFLSVIVNTAGKRIAKIAIVAEVQKKFSYTLVKKLLSFRSKPSKYLGIIDCEVVIENEESITKEIKIVNTIKAEKKKAFHKKAYKPESYPDTHYTKQTYEYSAPIKPQPEMFDDYERETMIEEVLKRGDIIDNRDRLENEAIENLIVRSISVDDLASANLQDAVSLINRKLPKDYSLEISSMMAHFFESLQSEYYYDQFYFVVSRVIEFLDEYTIYKFVDGIVCSLQYWIDVFDTSNTPSIRNDDISDSVEWSDEKGFRSNDIRYPKTQEANEF